MGDVPPGSGHFQALLRLQECDIAIDQMVYRRDNLPAHAALADVQRRATILKPQLADATSRRDSVAQRQATLEAEIDSLQRRAAEINSRLYGTSPVSPRDAQAMAEEVKHVDERRKSLEDSDLEVMEELEPLQAELSGLEHEAQVLAADSRQAQAGLAASQQELDEELIVARRERETVSSGVTDTLRAEYERLRPSLGGIAVAPLVNGSCGGCHLTLSAAELSQIRKAPDDAVVSCEECGRILVRGV